MTYELPAAKGPVRDVALQGGLSDRILGSGTLRPVHGNPAQTTLIARDGYSDPVHRSRQHRPVAASHDSDRCIHRRLGR